MEKREERSPLVYTLECCTTRSSLNGGVDDALIDAARGSKCGAIRGKASSTIFVEQFLENPIVIRTRVLSSLD